MGSAGLPETSAALSVDELVSSASQGDQKIILLYLVLFAVCLLSVIRVLPYDIAFAAVLVCALLQTRTPYGQWTIPCF